MYILSDVWLIRTYINFRCLADTYLYFVGCLADMYLY